MFGAVASSQITSSNPVSSFAIGPQPQVFGYLESHLDARNADEPREQPETLRRGPSRRVPTAAQLRHRPRKKLSSLRIGLARRHLVAALEDGLRPDEAETS
jgi:hypothetical protein